MALLQYLSSGTPADGTAATAANTGVLSGGFVLGSGASATWRTAQGNRGERGLQLVAVGTASSTIRWALSANNARAAFTGVLTTPQSAPSNVATVLNIRASGGVAARLQWNAAGELFIFDIGNVTRGVIPAGTLALNTQYVVQIIISGASTTAGTVSLRVLSMAGQQLAEVSGSGANFTANPIAQFDVFPAGSTTTYGWADLQMEDGRTSYIAPIPSSVSYTGSLALSGTGTQDRTGTPTLTGSLASEAIGIQTRDTSLTVADILERSAEGTGSRVGSPSFTGLVSETGSVDSDLSGAALIFQTLKRTASAALGLTSRAHHTGLLDSSTEVTLTLTGQESKPLKSRHVQVFAPRTEASISYRNNTRTEVRVP
jgi:hypothetical protein